LCSPALSLASRHLTAIEQRGNSLRAGHATSVAIAGASERSIMNQTGHRSVQMVRRYIRSRIVLSEIKEYEGTCAKSKSTTSTEYCQGVNVGSAREPPNSCCCPASTIANVFGLGHGELDRRYQSQVPMILPRLKGATGDSDAKAVGRA